MSDVDESRRRAEEENLRGQVGEDPQRARLLTELQMHQAELEVQNEELRRTRDELQAAHDRYFDLFELAPVGYLTLGRRGQILAANLAAASFLGITRDRLIGLSFPSLLPVKDADAFHLHQERVFAKWGRKQELEVRIRRGDGGLATAVIEALAYEDAGQARCRMALIDVTERRQAETRLREREARLAVILDTVLDAIITMDAAGTIESVNAATTRLFGYQDTELVGRPISLLVAAERRDKFHTMFKRSLGPGPSNMLGKVQRVPARRRDASVFPAELAVAEVRQDKGRLFVGVVRDVSEREERERHLRESLTRFQQIADRIEDVFYIVEPSSGRLVYVSPAFSRVFGRPLEEATAAGTWTPWIHVEDVPRIRAALERSRTGSAFDEEYRIVLPDGSERRVRDRGYPLAGQDRLTGILHDVTDERQMEEGLRHAQRLETVGTLASGIAHDFNNLLMGLAGLGNMALRTLDSESPAAGYIRRAVAATMRGAALTRQLLVFSGQRRVSAAAIELDATVRGARELIDRLVGEHIHVVLETEAPGVLVVAEPGEIEQILLNLCSNARDAMLAGGELTVRTMVGTGGIVSLSVRDSGQGMDARTRERVFEPFFTTKETGRGTGLGLSTVFALARQRGGQVAIESQPGRGTTVTVSLPIATGEGDQAGAIVGEPRGTETILVVEDDPLVRGTLESYVTSLGYRALMAADANQALRILDEAGEAAPLDLLLTDVVMPGRLGGDLARQVTELRPGLPVLFMSAHPRGELERLGRVAPGSRLLAKPFDRRELAFAVRAAIDEATMAAGEAAPAVLIVDDNRELAESLQEGLEASGCMVAVARDSREALRLAAELHPRLVLCDLQLGEGQSGADVVQAVRASDQLRDISVVAMTGFADPATASDALAAGFDAVLSKPVELDEIERLARRPPRRPEVRAGAAHGPARTAG
jgi:two-component system cell cycle sensor histidine kinase/response regulator CckA